MADTAEQAAQGACARQQVQEGLRHQRAVRSACKLARGPEPEAPQAGNGSGPEQEACQPQQEGQCVQAQQGAQRPKHVDRPRSIAECAQGRACARCQGQQEQGNQDARGAAAPRIDQWGKIFALRQQLGAGKDAGRQVRVHLTHAPHSLRVLQGAPVRLAQADQFGQPVRAQGALAGVVGHGVEVARGRGRHRVGVGEVRPLGRCAIVDRALRKTGPEAGPDQCLARAPRYWPGVTPVASRKTRARWLALPKPLA
ncbi:hypothetical protein D3C87_1415840 [compost metagenome]